MARSARRRVPWRTGSGKRDGCARDDLPHLREWEDRARSHVLGCGNGTPTGGRTQADGGVLESVREAIIAPSQKFFGMAMEEGMKLGLFLMPSHPPERG